ncbi:MAG TPA: BatA domain-containing protein [Planctomycetota bacterium]|nr:BatA domain-containing protein [Planctomycetota bacterium]
MPVLAAFLDFFVNPGLLAGLALLSAPVIIHLLNKRHFNIVDWAAMDFLLQAEARNRRRLRFEDILLLLLRMLVLALLVFTLARPLLQGFGGAREEERIVILDDSMSMETNDGTGTAFSAARAAAVSQVEDAVGRGIPVSIWSGTRPEQGGLDLRAAEPPPATSAASLGGGGTTAGEAATATRPAVDPEEAAGVLGQLRARQANDAALRLGGLMDRILDRFEARKEAGVRSVVLVSDFRASDWFEEEGGALRSDIAAALAELKRAGHQNALRWRFVNTGKEERENVGLMRIRAATDHPLVKVPVRLIVEVKNFGKADRKHLTGDLEVGESAPADAASRKDGAARAQGGVRVLHRIPLPAIELIPAGKSATTEVEFTFEKAGQFLLSARFENDRLAPDDVSFAVVHVRDGLRVPVVDGDPQAGRFSGESGFVLAGLAPRGTVPSGILPRRIAGEITEKDLRGADVVLILNRASISAAERAALQGFVEDGGGIAFFLGNKVTASSYEGLSLFPAKLGAVQETASRARLRIGKDPHAAFDVFRGVEGSSLEQVGFDRFFSMVPSPGAVVAASFNDPEGTPAVLDSSAGKGRVAVFNLSADRDWNDWPTDPSYPIILQEWVRYLAPKGSGSASITAGDVLSWEAAPGVQYDVVPPAGEPVRISPKTAPENRDERDEKGSSQAPTGAKSAGPELAATHTAGFYVIVPSPSVRGSMIPPEHLERSLRACRRDPRDSDLEPAGEARLRAALAPAGVEFVMGSELGADLYESREEGETWRWLAYAAGLFLVVELFVAWWFGRR